MEHAEEDDERVAAERESLTEIYGQLFVIISDREWQMTIIEKPRTAALFFLPEGYPSYVPPSVAIEAEFATDNELSDLNDRLRCLFEESGGNEIVFEYIEFMKDRLGQIAEAYSTKQNCLENLLEIEEIQEANSSSDFISVPCEDSVLSKNPPEEAQNNDGWTFHPETSRFKQPARRFAHVVPPASPIKVVHGEVIEDRKSKFEAHLARVQCQNDVHWVYSQLLQDKRVAKASHNVVCYRFEDQVTGTLVHDNDDDGETGAGNRLAEMMHLMQANNVFVMVSRWYGGIHLGPDRFRHFNNCAQRLLADCGFQRKGKGRTTRGKGKGKQK